MSREMQRPAGPRMDVPNDPGSFSVRGFYCCASSSLGGMPVLVMGDPLFAGSARAGAAIGTVMFTLAQLGCTYSGGAAVQTRAL